jgi:hypothetical protein
MKFKKTVLLWLSGLKEGDVILEIDNNEVQEHHGCLKIYYDVHR